MLFKRIYDADLAQASYFIGCQKSGEAIVIDPRRDTQVYQDEARDQDMRIVAVTETHIHADYLSGSRELAEATGATLYLSDEGGEDWDYLFPHTPLKHGETITVGNLRLEARHTPGHTPEHLSFLLTDGAMTEHPGYFLTGDFMFVGDLGRPDLLDESGLGADTREPMAGRLFESIKREFLSLPDYVQVWPGHGAGSACGKALGAVASSTVGYERLTAWWAPYVLEDDLTGFVAALLEGQPEAPSYFARMKRQNREGPALIGDQGAPEVMEPSTLEAAQGHLLLVDTRSRAVYERDAAVGALHIPAGKSFVTYASYVIDPERETRDIVLVADTSAQAKALRDSLVRVGIDIVIGYVSDLGNLERAPVPTVSPEALETLENPYILDIRTQSEYDAGHLPGAQRIHAGRVMADLGALPQDRPLVTHCQSGARNTVVSSALRLAGFNVLELEGSYLGWQRAMRSATRR